MFTLRDIPPVGRSPALEGNGQRVYYGEGAPGDAAFVVVDTGTEELDYQGTATDDQAQATFTYDGDGGIPIGGLFQRALFAWRYRDVNLLISDLIHGDSRIMIYRDITARVPKAAPFLRFDADPYSAVVDGRLVWIWDAYTTTNQYPYSDFVDLVRGRVAVGARRGRPVARRGRELHPQLGEGRRRRVRRLDALLRRRSERPDHPGVEPRVPDAVHPARPGAAGAPRALPVPGEPVPGPGVRVHELPRHRSERVLRQAGLLGAADRPDRVHGGRPPPDAAVLRPDALAGRGGRDVRADPALHAARPPEHGGLARGQVGPRARLRRHRELRVPVGGERRRADAGLLPDQPGRALLVGADAARPGRLERSCSGTSS